MTINKDYIKLNLIRTQLKNAMNFGKVNGYAEDQLQKVLMIVNELIDEHSNNEI